MSTDQKKVWRLRFYGAMIILIICLFMFQKFERAFILKDFSFTSGKIISLSRSDGAGTYFEYKYTVDSINFLDEIVPHTSKYNKCYGNLKLCDSLNFWVIYSNSRHRRSMIDFSEPILEGEDPSITRQLDNFEN